MPQHPVSLPAHLLHPTQQLSCICVGAAPVTSKLQFEVLHFDFSAKRLQPVIYETFSINNAFAFATILAANEANRYGTEGQQP